MEATIEPFIVAVCPVEVDLNILVKIDWSIDRSVTCLKLVLFILLYVVERRILLLEEADTSGSCAYVFLLAIILRLNHLSVLGIEEVSLLDGELSKVLGKNSIFFLSLTRIDVKSVATDTVQSMDDDQELA